MVEKVTALTTQRENPMGSYHQGGTFNSLALLAHRRHYTRFFGQIKEKKRKFFPVGARAARSPVPCWESAAEEGRPVQDIPGGIRHVPTEIRVSDLLPQSSRISGGK
jgi:hypothetical protein